MECLCFLATWYHIRPMQNNNKPKHILRTFSCMCWVSILCKQFAFLTRCIQIHDLGSCWWLLSRRSSPRNNQQFWEAGATASSSSYSLSCAKEFNYCKVLVMDECDSFTQNQDCRLSTYGNVVKCNQALLWCSAWVCIPAEAIVWSPDSHRRFARLLAVDLPWWTAYY